jgi:glycosyltransferase involved in cell wall biosynthesis
LLIVGINYSPEEAGNAPYTTGFAEHMAGAGHEVHVLTGVPHYPRWRPMQRLRGTSHALINGVHVHRSWHYVPSRQTALRRALYEATFLSSAVSLPRLPCPDAILAVVPALSDGVVARVASRRFKAPYGVLFQDLMGQAAGQSGVAGGSKVESLVRACEGWVAREASATAIVAEGFRPYVESIGAVPSAIERVYNWCHVPRSTGNRDEFRRQLGWPGSATVVLHAGNMGHKQGLGNILAAARLAKADELDLLFALAGDGNQRRELEDETASLGLDNVRFYGPQESQAYADMLAAADVLALSQRPGVTDMAFPSKLTSYLAAGRPIVAAVSGTSEAARELTACDGGLVVEPGDPLALIGVIKRLRSDDLLRQRLIRAARAHAPRFDREPALKTWARFAEKICRSAPRRHQGLDDRAREAA